MGVRRAAILGLVAVLLAFATIGQGGAAGGTAVIIADLQCSGDVLVKRAGGEEVAAYVGLQLFPKDSIVATEPAVVTLFDDGSGTTTQDVKPGTPFVLGAAQSAQRHIVAGLTSSLSDLFGSAEQAHKRDQEVGAVQAGAVIARLPVAESASDRLRAQNSLAETRAASFGQRAAAPAAPGSSDVPSKQALAGKIEAQAAPPQPAVQAPAAPAPAPNMDLAPVAAPQASPAAQATEDEPQDATASAPEGTGSKPGVGGTLGDGTEADKQVKEQADDLIDEPAAPVEAPVDSRSRAPVREPANPKSRAMDATALIAQLETLKITDPLARARATAMPESVPLLAGQMVRGTTTFTANGAAVTQVNQTLVPGAKVRIHVQLAGGKAWDTELVIATDAEFNDVKARANQLLKAKLPNARLLVANLLEARGYVLLAYAIRLKAARLYQSRGTEGSLARSLWITVGQQALQLGDWGTARSMAARSRKK